MEPIEKKSKCTKPKFLIYGAKTGWIGKHLVQLCKELELEFAIGDARIENITNINNDLDTHQPTHVLMAAGLTGRPTVDWCEEHKPETIRTNVIGTLAIVDCCKQRGIHITNFATGCIFEYDDAHPIGAPGFAESDVPNFHGSFYSHTKALVEDLLQHYDNCLTLRIRMPISAELTARNFVTKIVNYAKVVDVPNSMTVLEEMLPIAIRAAEFRMTGILNLVNPGVISHNEILQMYKTYIDNRFFFFKPHV